MILAPLGGGVSALTVLLMGYCTISDYNKQNSVTKSWPLNGH